MVFDLTPIEPDKTLFERQDWSYSTYGYESLKEELPSDMPVPHGQLCVYLWMLIMLEIK